MAPPNQKGNRWTDKAWREAIRMAVSEKQGDVKALRALANKLVDMGLAGDVQAIREIGDRLDGKPAQSIDLAVTDERNVIRAPEMSETPADWQSTYTPKPH